MGKSVNVDAHPITDYERTHVLPLLKKAFIQRHLSGKTNEISARKILELLSKKAGIKLADSRLRKLLFHLRQDGFPIHNGVKYFLCSTHNGYKISSDPRVLESFIEKEQNRINAQQMTVDAAKRDLEFIIQIKNDR